jgi:DNA-binding XRE family transcriptional regulator
MDVAAASADTPAQEGVSSGTGKPTKKRATGRPIHSSAGTANRSLPAPVSRPSKPRKRANRVRESRIERMMSKAELARRAGLSVLTIDRAEKGLECRMDTKRKILEALGLNLADRIRVFGEEE